MSNSNDIDITNRSCPECGGVYEHVTGCTRKARGSMRRSELPHIGPTRKRATPLRSDMLEKGLDGHTTTLACSNDCNHNCDIQITADENAIAQATAAGWTVVLWETEVGQAEHNAHMVAFCDPGCMYTWLRARLLADPHWEPRLADRDDEAENKAIAWGLLGHVGHEH